MTTSFSTDKSINKNFVQEGNKSIFKIVAPSNTEYTVYYDNNKENDSTVLNIVVPHGNGSSKTSVTMDFSNFLDNSCKDPFFYLNVDLNNIHIVKKGEGIDPRFDDEFDCSTLTMIAEHITDALIIGEEVTRNIIPTFSLVSRELQAEAMYTIIQMNIKYKNYNVYEDMMRHSINDMRNYIENM